MSIYRYQCTQEEWKEFIEAMHSGGILEIDREMFMYWLEVLPPVYMHEEIEIEGRKVLCSFGFAEGRELITDFWREHGKFFCKGSARMNPY